MKQTHLLIPLLFLSSLPEAHSCAFTGGELWPPITAFEQEPLVRVEVTLPSASDETVIVNYATEEAAPIPESGFPAGIARAGRDYVPIQGSLTFAPGQTAAHIDIPLLDNGVRDGPRDFQVHISETSADGGLSLEQQIWIRIEDNELGSTLDPLYLPPISADATRTVLLSTTSDGRCLVEDTGQHPAFGWSTRLRALDADGHEDTRFAVNVIQGRNRANLGPLRFVTTSAEGSIVALASPATPEDSGIRIVRMNRDGTIRVVSTVPISSSDFLHSIPGMQSDGKLLVVAGTQGPASVQYRLFRIQLDGARDMTFRESAFARLPDQILIDARDRILVVTGDGTPSPRLRRLHPDGTSEEGFPAAPIQQSIERLIELQDSSLLLLQSDLAQIHLGPAGDLLPMAAPILPIIHGRTLWPLTQGPEGTLWSSTYASFDAAVVAGSLPAPGASPRLIQVRLPVQKGNCGSYFPPEAPNLAWTPTGLLVANLADVEGIPCRGLARLRTNPPEREFRVLSPLEISRSDGVANLRIVRTGPTTNPASISFRTLDLSANAGIDFVSAAGRLDFAPLEVGKDISIRLMPASGLDERRTFLIALSDATDGYGLVAKTPVKIAPDLQVKMAAQYSHNSGPSLFAAIHGTQPGYEYVVEKSSDLIHWESGKPILASDTVTRLESFEPSAKRAFLRIIR